MSVRTSITEPTFHDNYCSAPVITSLNDTSSSSHPTTTIDLFMRGEPILVDFLLHHDEDICLQDIDDHHARMENMNQNQNHQQHIIGQQQELSSPVAITCTPPILTNLNTLNFDNNKTINNYQQQENTTTNNTINHDTFNHDTIIVGTSNNNNGMNIVNIVDGSITSSTAATTKQLFIETKQDNSKELILPSNLVSNDNSPANSEISSAVSVTSYGSSLPSTPNNSHQSSSFFNSSATMVTNDETDWEIIVKNRNAQQIARMASATGLVFNNNPSSVSSSSSSSLSSSNLLNHHSLTTPKLDTSSLNETSFRKNMITRHSSDQKIAISSNNSNKCNGESTFGSGSGKQRRKTSFLWGRSLERTNSNNGLKPIDETNAKLDISASSIDSSVTNDTSDESFFEFLQSVDCRMNVVSIDSIDSTSIQATSTKETLKKSKFWDRLKVIKKAIKKQLMEEEKPNSTTLHTQQPSKHTRTNSNTTHPHTLDLDCKSTSSSSLTSVSDEDKYTVVITKPTNGTIRSAEDEMRYCLNDPICLQLFDEFCCQECSQENLLLWKELNKVKTNFKKLSDKRRSKTLRTIHSKFFSENNENFDVNVSGRTKVQIEEQANSKRVSLVSGAHVLNSLQRDCINNLCDSFSRFILTEDYKLWKQNFDR